MEFQDVVEGCVAYAPNFVADDIGKAMFNRLVTDVAWRQEHMKFGDNKVPLPRLVAWYGDPGARYFYSGIHNEPLFWPPGELTTLRNMCNALFPDFPFNSVLLNWYRSGDDSIGYHVDNERDLVNNSTIATVSLGGPRTFHLKSKAGSGEVKKVVLEHGSLLLMYGDCQKRWLHGIPKEPELAEPRISLTFRTVNTR